MTDPDELDPATLRAIADELSADADAEAEAGERHKEAAARAELTQARAYAAGFVAGYVVNLLASKADQLRDLALRIEMGRGDQG